jgi:hypothetical protein
VSFVAAHINHTHGDLNTCDDEVATKEREETGYGKLSPWERTEEKDLFRVESCNSDKRHGD